jgi:two-component system OmpR family response regulator
MAKTDKRIRIFSALEVANLCGVVNQTCINWIRGGHLKAFTTPGGQYRVYAEDLVRFLEERGMRVPPELDISLKVELDASLMLVVDDDHDLNTILKRMLERRFPPRKAIQAFDGFEAGKLLMERRPSLILLDFDLPGINGLVLCDRIKTDPSFGQPAVISMTGLDREDVRTTMLGAGADAFFPKPMDFEALLAKVAELLPPLSL